MIRAFEMYGVGCVEKKEEDHTDDLGVDGSKVIKLILKKRLGDLEFVCPCILMHSN
jgi:hypothetical protein